VNLWGIMVLAKKQSMDRPKRKSYILSRLKTPSNLTQSTVFLSTPIIKNALRISTWKPLSKSCDFYLFSVQTTRNHSSNIYGF